MSGKSIKIVVVGEDGRVTLPIEIRRALKIKIGDRVIWTLEPEHACLKKIR